MLSVGIKTFKEKTEFGDHIMKKKQFLIKLRMFNRAECVAEIDTPWTGQQFDADNDDAYLTAYTGALAGLKKVLNTLVDGDNCKTFALFGKERKPVEHTVQLLCYDGNKYEIYKTIKFD